jgi:hypothetical protein
MRTPPVSNPIPTFQTPDTTVDIRTIPSVER